MALLYCPECAGAVSSLAAACPHCGCPFTPPAEPPSEDDVGFVAYQSPPAKRRGRPRVQTIEQTAKVWKAHLLFSALLTIAGIGVIVVGVAIRERERANDGEMHTISILGLLITVIGAVWFTWARVGAWWHHG